MTKSQITVILSLLLCLSLCSCGKSYVANELNVIPEPVSVTTKARSFTISNNTKVCFPNLGQNSKTARYITKSLRQLHFHLKLSARVHTNAITFVINDSVENMLGDEGYTIEIRPSGILISANTESGLFYGYQTFIQLLPEDIYKVRYSKVTLPECTIVDYPQFAWRGCHLDVSRHFFTTKQVKRLLDIMAAYKLNKFHWHLTDDHGWRIQSDHYPLLNSVGSWRGDRSDVPWLEALPPIKGEPQTYGGYYSREDIADIVAYAAQLHIDVVPEIDLPGHCSALLAAYPQLSCYRDSSLSVQTGPYWPPMAVMCMGNDSLLSVVQTILDEVISLFPYEYIHIGCNEVVFDNWEQCPRCQSRMRSLHISHETELLDWFASQMSQYLHSKDRHLIGWDEIVDAELCADDIIISWQGMQGGIEAVRSGHLAIMSPAEYCSFDSYQANPKYQPQALGNPLTLEKVYSFSPLMKELTPEQANLVIGGQCELWTEYVSSWQHAEYMLLPRLCALSEDLWTPQDRKSWPHFKNKIVSHKLRFTSLDYNYCEGSYKPLVKISHHQNDSYLVTISSEVDGTFIYYSLDGSMPTLESPTYVEPLILKEGTVLRLRSVFNGLPREEVYDYVIK